MFHQSFEGFTLGSTLAEAGHEGWAPSLPGLMMCWFGKVCETPRRPLAAALVSHQSCEGSTVSCSRLRSIS